MWSCCNHHRDFFSLASVRVIQRFSFSNPMGVDVELGNTAVADTVPDSDEVADETHGSSVAEDVLQLNSTQLTFEHGAHGQVEFHAEPGATVRNSSGVAASDPISQYPSLFSDPISQFTSISGCYMDNAEPFDVDTDDAGKRLDEWSVCGSGIDESINRLNLRRAIGSQCGDGDALGHAESLGAAGSSVQVGRSDINPNLDHESAMRAFNSSLSVNSPKFMWEGDGFLGTVFSSGTSVVDQLFKPVALKRPAPCFVDLSNDSLDKTPIAKALRTGAVKPIYLGSFSRASSENENSKRKAVLFVWMGYTCSHQLQCVQCAGRCSIRC